MPPFTDENIGAQRGRCGGFSPALLVIQAWNGSYARWATRQTYIVSHCHLHKTPKKPTRLPRPQFPGLHAFLFFSPLCFWVSLSLLLSPFLPFVPLILWTTLQCMTLIRSPFSSSSFLWPNLVVSIYFASNSAGMGCRGWLTHFAWKSASPEQQGPPPVQSVGNVDGQIRTLGGAEEPIAARSAPDLISLWLLP